jgi:flagellar biosynthesis/type III secretory pathway protein FliH
VVAFPLLGSREEVEREAVAWFDEIDAVAEDPVERARFEEVFLRLLTRRLTDLDVGALFERGGRQVEDTETGRRLLAKGERAGREEGHRAGREEGQRAGREEGQRAGREEGHRAGREEGQRAGREAGLRQALREVVAGALGEVPSWFEEQAARLTGEEALRRVLREAARLRSAEDLARLLGGEAPWAGERPAAP